MSDLASTPPIDISADLLFPVPEVLSPRLAWQKRVTAELGIFTHYCDASQWMAFSHVKAIEFIGAEYLADSMKTDAFELFAGFCRVLDDARMVADGEPTEFDAVLFVAIRHGVKLWNEEQTPAA